MNKCRVSCLVIVMSVILSACVFSQNVSDTQTAPLELEVAASSTVSPGITAVLTLSPTETMTPVPTSSPLPSAITDDVGVAMMFVPAGEFTMGRDADDALADCQKYRNDCLRDWFVDEEPPHQVGIRAYYMDTYEVTNAFYKTCVDAGTCTEPQKTDFYADPDYANHPVVYVDWNQAKTYCGWRGGSLPTEAQWEKAARGTDDRAYPWGDGIDCSKANAFDSAQDKACVGASTEVGSYADWTSPYGLHDMAGNVWEWVADWYKSYPGNSVSNQKYGHTYRGLRGGAWNNGEYSLRVTNRLSLKPNATGSNIGFRCVRGVSP